MSGKEISKNQKKFNKKNQNKKESSNQYQIKDNLGFIIIGSNGSKLISNSLLKLNLKKVPNISDTEYYIKWTDVPSQIDWDYFSEFKQMVNHIPNSNLITNKGNLLQILRQFNRLTKSMLLNTGMIDMDSYFPETYYINNSKELQTFYENIHRNNIWIYKPTDLNQGIGISLIRDKDSLDSILSKDLSSPNISRRPTGRIIQRYIMNPLLVNNRKFDIRAYMLIANTTPFLVLYHSGYLRLSLEEYANDSDKLLIHLTNQYVQKKDPKYESVKDDTVWSMEQFSKYLNTNLEVFPQITRNWVKNVLITRMKLIMRQVFHSVKNKLTKQVGLFELFGFDFMVDSDFKVWLIEVNVNPSLDTNCSVLKQKLPVIIENSLEIAIECFEKCKQKTNLLPLENLSDFEIIYSDNSNWNWSRYMGGMKLNVPLMRIYKTPNNNASLKSYEETETPYKIQRSKTNLFNHIPRAYSISPVDSRKFPLSLTQKLYRESNLQSVPPNIKWIKT